MDKILVSIVKNWAAKNSKIGQIIKIVSIIVAVVTGLPAFAESIGFPLPDNLSVLADKAVSLGAIISAFIAQLTNEELEK